MNNKYGYKNMRTRCARLSLRPFSALSPLSLRYTAILLLLLVVGAAKTWGQTDYSGTYYISSNNKGSRGANTSDRFYLCPSTDMYAESQPFVTTKKTNKGSDSKWIIKFVKTVDSKDYYHVIHVASNESDVNKYLTYNEQLVSDNDARVRVHLQESLDETEGHEDYNLFYITAGNVEGSIVICPKEDRKYYDNENVRSLNPAKANFDQYPGKNQSSPGSFTGYGGNTIYCGGLIGLWQFNDNNSTWFLEEYISRPTITNTNNQIVMSHSEDGATIYYTIDGTNPTTTNYAGTGPAPLQIDMLQNSATLKVVAAKSDNLPSCVSEIRVVPNPTISLASSPIVYNGSEQTPTFSVMDGENVIPESEYTIGNYSNNKNVGTATVTITDNAGGDYIVYGSTTFTINPKPLTITAKPKTITYGDVPANDGVTYGEFAGTETESVLTGTLAYAYNYEQYDDAGSYTITPSGLSNDNYDITFVPGTLTVNPKAVTVTSGITATDKTYDGTTAATLDGTDAVIEGKIGSDELTVEVGSGTFEDKDVGTDKIVTINSFTFGGAKAGNYQMAASGHQATARASITPATLTVNAEAKSKTYGDADPAFTYTSEGLFGSDGISGSLSRAEGEDVGTYAINKGSLTAGSNYSISFTGANLTISAKSLGDGINAAEGIAIVIEQEEDVIQVTVTDGGTTLVKDEDYTVTIEAQGAENIVTVSGIGNYGGSAQGLYVKTAFMKPTGATQYAAVYQASLDLAKPNGINLYIVRKVNPSIGTLAITPVAYIPKDVPVLMLSNDEITGFLASEKPDVSVDEIPLITAETRNSNLLKVAPSGGVGVKAAEVYMFYRGEFVLTMAGTLSEGKFFLYNPNFTATPEEGEGEGESRSCLQYVLEALTEPTEIIELKNPKIEEFKTDVWYTLDGRRLSGKPTKQGLYIWNGRKTIIKRH